MHYTARPISSLIWVIAWSQACIQLLLQDLSISSPIWLIVHVLAWLGICNRSDEWTTNDPAGVHVFHCCCCFGLLTQYTRHMHLVNISSFNCRQQTHRWSDWQSLVYHVYTADMQACGPIITIIVTVWAHCPNVRVSHMHACMHVQAYSIHPLNTHFSCHPRARRLSYRRLVATHSCSLPLAHYSLILRLHSALLLYFHPS